MIGQRATTLVLVAVIGALAIWCWLHGRALDQTRTLAQLEGALRHLAKERAAEKQHIRGLQRDAQRIVITLDTSLVEGWNEIDAVGLVTGEDVVWGASGTASSEFGAQPFPR